MSKEKRLEGALTRTLIFLWSLRAKGYMAKAKKSCKTRLKLKSSSFLLEGYVGKDLASEGYVDREFPLPVYPFAQMVLRQKAYIDKGHPWPYSAALGAALFAGAYSQLCIYDNFTLPYGTCVLACK